MADKPNEDVDLVDLFLYAPIGLLYEYQDVIPKLVKRGKSQVQVGMLLGKMAAAKGTKEAEKQAGDVITTIAALAARGITEFGQVVGLAPPTDTGVGATGVTEPGPDSNDAAPAELAPTADTEAARQPRLPIAGYDDLTAREIIGLLEELSGPQRVRVKEHELANRGRKTVIAKLDALAAKSDHR